MLLLLLPLLNSSSMKNFLHPFSKDSSSGSAGDETLCPICQANPTTMYLYIAKSKLPFCPLDYGPGLRPMPIGINVKYGGTSTFS